MFVRRISAVASCLVLLGTVAPSAHADATTEARNAIQADYNRIDAAIAKKDAQTVFNLYSPDFVGIDINGKKHPLAEMKAQFPKVLQSAQSAKAKTVITKFSLKGKEAMTTIKTHRERVLVNPRTKKPATIAVDAVIEEVWAQKGKTWLKKSARTLSQDLSLNGKSVPVPK